MFKKYLLSFILLNAICFSNADNFYNSAPACDQTAGKADSYVFALSLQPGFCETSGFKAGKPECTGLNRDSIYRKEIGLHGLWPNQDACGTNYGFCNDTKSQTNFCDYAPLQLSNTVSMALKEVMASYAAGSCLERHEWNKHGSCQLRTQDNYFTLAVIMLSQINQSDFRAAIIHSMGYTIDLATLKTIFDRSFGPNSSKKVQFICTNGVLTDMYINMPNLDKTSSTDFIKLLQLATDNKQADKCPATVTISDFYAVN